MLRAALRHKVTPWLGQHAELSPPDAWRQIVHRNEDLLTSSVFERLGYLAESRGVSLLFRACTWVGPARPDPGPIVEAHPWPSPMEDDKRQPDWVFVLPGLVVVIEAKWGDGNVPSRGQIADQIEVVRSRWKTEPLVHLAVVQSGAVEFPEGVVGGVVRWAALHGVVVQELAGESPPHERRVLEAIREVLAERGAPFRPQFLDSLPAITVELEPWT